jgi:hypothetical protein
MPVFASRKRIRVSQAENESQRRADLVVPTLGFSGAFFLSVNAVYL